MLNLFYKKCIELNVHNKIYIGYSGGIDSSVLLDLSCNLFKQSLFEIKVIHIGYSHNLYYKNWYNFCKFQCDKYKIPMIYYLLDSSNKSNNLENIYRIMRYRIFFRNINRNTSFLIAHNLSDLSETFFLNLTRGSGISGLTGIKEKYKYKNINILRPLLSVDRKDIFKYAIKNNLEYIIDFSNLNSSYKRNFIRYIIYPILDKKINDITNLINRCSRIISSTNFYLQERCNFFFKKINNEKKVINTLYIKKIPRLIKYEILRIWIKHFYNKTPSIFQLTEIIKFINKRNKNKYMKIKNYYISSNIKNVFFINNAYIYRDFIVLNSLDYDFYIKNVKEHRFVLKKKSTFLKKSLYITLIHLNYNLISLGLWESCFHKVFIKSKIKVLV